MTECVARKPKAAEPVRLNPDRQKTIPDSMDAKADLEGMIPEMQRSNPDNYRIFREFSGWVEAEGKGAIIAPRIIG